VGRYKIDGDTITFTSGGSDLCPEGDGWSWQARTAEDGRIHIVHGDEAADPCRIAAGTEWTLVRVSPRRVPPSATRASPIRWKGHLRRRATWWGSGTPLENTGLLINFGSDRTFSLDYAGQLDTRPAVRGTVRINGDTTVFTIGVGTPAPLAMSGRGRRVFPRSGCSMWCSGRKPLATAGSHAGPNGRSSGYPQAPRPSLRLLPRTQPIRQHSATPSGFL
jgi:hypothetical protein